MAESTEVEQIAFEAETIVGRNTIENEIRRERILYEEGIIGTNSHSNRNIENNFNNQNQNDENSLLLNPEDTSYYNSLLKISWYKRPSVILLSLPLFFILISYGILIPIEINLLISIVCQQYYNNNNIFSLINGNVDPICQIPQIHKKVSNIQLYASVMQSFLSIITISFYGKISDVFGRKKIFFLCYILIILSSFGLLLSIVYPSNVGFYGYFIQMFFNGLSSSPFSFLMLGNSYISDCTPKYLRSSRFSFVYGVFLVGIGIGPTLGGIISKKTNSFFKPLLTAIFFQIIGLFTVIFLLPESISKRDIKLAKIKYSQEKENNKNKSYLLVFIKKFNFITPIKYLYNFSNDSKIRKNILLFTLIDVIMQFIFNGIIPVMLLYAELNFKWNSLETGYYLSFELLGKSIVILVIFPLVLHFLRKIFKPRQPKIGSDIVDIGILKFCFITEIIAYALLPFANSTKNFYLFGSLKFFATPLGSVINSSLSKYCSNNEIGTFLSSISLLANFTKLLSPIVFQSIYSYSISISNFKGFIFTFASILFSVCFILTCFIKRTDTPNDDDYETHFRRQSMSS